MDLFYWVIIGVLVALIAKVQLPTDREENMALLLTAGIGGAVLCGLALRAFAHTGVLSMGWVSFVAAFAGATLLVLGLRVATNQHLA